MVKRLRGVRDHADPVALDRQRRDPDAQVDRRNAELGERPDALDPYAGVGPAAVGGASAPRNCPAVLVVVTIEAAISLRRGPGYVARGTMLRCVRDVGGVVEIGASGATYSGGLEALEELQ